MLRCLIILCFVTTLVWAPASINAQSVLCQGRGADVFDATRRTRLVMDDVLTINSQLDTDMLSLRRLTHFRRKEGLMQEGRFRFALQPLASLTQLPDVFSCSTTGDRDAVYGQTRLGLVVGVADNKWDWSLRYILSRSSSELTSQVPGASSELAGTYGATMNQTVHALRLQATPWFALSLGHVTYGDLAFEDADDGTKLTTVSATDQSRQFMRLEVPRLLASVDVAFGQGLQNIESLILSYRHLFIYPKKLPVSLSFQAAYFDDEDQIFGVLSADWWEPGRTYSNRDRVDRSLLYRFRHRIGLDVATEFKQVNLRYARLRTSFDYIPFGGAQDRMMGPHYVKVGLYGDVSVFNGRFMQEQIEREQAFGASGRLSLGVSVIGMFVSLDTLVGWNRPDTLSHRVQAIDSLELGGQLRLHMGW